VSTGRGWRAAPGEGLLLALFLFLALFLAPAHAENAPPFTVTASPLKSFDLLGVQTKFGKLAWRGGLELKSSDKRFGGFSGLALSGDGEKLLAVSDTGNWFRANLLYKNGRLAGLSDPELSPLLDKSGKPFNGKSWNDVEALSPWQPGNIDGKVIVGFETRTRAGIYDIGKRGLKARFEPLPIPKDIPKARINSELEAIGRFATGPFKGRFIAISEKNLDKNGNLRAWIFGGKSPFAFSIKRNGDYVVTDLAIYFDSILTVERSFGTTVLPGIALRRFPISAIEAGATVAPEIIFEGRAPFYAIDNLEGMAVSSNVDGETRLTLISDDNFRRDIQRTLLLQFALDE
jgi:hypothetical protein